MGILKSIALIGIFFLSIGANAQNKTDKRVINDAKKAKKTLLKADIGLNRFFRNSAGYVLFPNVGKGGFIIGGASGKGVVYKAGKMIGMAGLKKLNIGFQAGGQAIIEIIFFENNVDLERFTEGKFQFAAEASAVALKSGISANARYKDGVAVFALPKAGLMADASVGGQKFSYRPF